MRARQDLAVLMSRIRSASTAREITLDLNWEKARILDGAGFIMAGRGFGS
jgi:hypothetical protein